MIKQLRIKFITVTMLLVAVMLLSVFVVINRMSLNEEIDNYNRMIQEKLLESQQILEYMQLSEGENTYLENTFF